MAARSERWRRTRRVSEHHRRPRGRRRRSASLQSSTLRPFLSPAARSCHQRGGIGRNGGGSRRRRNGARRCHRHGQGAGRATDELVASHPSAAWRLAFEWRRLCSRCHRCVGRTLSMAGGVSHRHSRALPSSLLVRRSSFRTSGTWPIHRLPALCLTQHPC